MLCLIQVPGCYMIVLTMLLKNLFQVPGCWKAALINKWSPVKNVSFKLQHICWELKHVKREREHEREKEGGKRKPRQYSHLID